MSGDLNVSLSSLVRRSIVSALFVVLAMAIPAAAAGNGVASGSSSSAPRAQGPVPSDPDIDYHQVIQNTDGKARCTATFGEGVGYCNGGPADEMDVRPSLGAAKWYFKWWPCGQGPVKVPNCQPGWIAIRIEVGDNHIDGFMVGRGNGNLYFLDAAAPAWRPRSPITGPNAPFAKTGDPGGPLSIKVTSHFCVGGDCYDFEIGGYVLYKRLLQTFNLSGFVQYRTGATPAASHPFNAKLEVFDTPSAPACNNKYLEGAGGCSGTFTADSTPPFRGYGGSIHWRKGTERYFLQQVFAPSGSTIDGFMYAGVNAYVVNSGTAPEWGTDIRTGPDITAYGQENGPLLSTLQSCCQVSRGTPGTHITRVNVDRKSRRAKFYFDEKGATRAKGFDCKLDRGRFRRCSSPTAYSHLRGGRHVFRVRARGATGAVDRTAATMTFKI